MFWAVAYSPLLYCDYIKSDPNRDNFLKFFVDEIIPTKMSMMNSYFVATGNISKNRFVHST